MFESYQMDHAKGLMIIDCSGADENEPDLKDPRCLRAVLRNLSSELRVEGIILNHHREKHYGRRTLRALRETMSLSSLHDQLAGQDPLPNFPGLAKKEVQARCGSCQFNPSSLFPRLKELLLGDLPRIDYAGFSTEFATRAGELGRHRYKGCRNCTARAVADLSFLLSEVESFSDRILAPGQRGK